MSALEFIRGETTLVLAADGYAVVSGLEIDGFAGGDVRMSLDDFRWLIVTAGPAVLHAMLERDAGGDGGGTPPPAQGEATEAPDEPEPDLFGATVPDDRGDPHTVGCPACKSPPGTACMTPGGMVARPHAARKRLVAG